MGKHPSPGDVLNVADHAFALALKFGAAMLQTGVQLVYAILGLLDIGG